MANDDEVFALTIWHNELVQLLNYLVDRKVNQESIQSVVEEVTKNGKLPLKLKCLWSSYNGTRNLRRIYAMY